MFLVANRVSRLLAELGRVRSELPAVRSRKRASVERHSVGRAAMSGDTELCSLQLLGSSVKGSLPISFGIMYLAIFLSSLALAYGVHRLDKRQSLRDWNRRPMLFCLDCTRTRQPLLARNGTLCCPECQGGSLSPINTLETSREVPHSARRSVV